MINTTYGDSGGAIFTKGVPDEHETIDIIERVFQSGQRRGAACNMGFIDSEKTSYKYYGLDAMSYVVLTLKSSPTYFSLLSQRYMTIYSRTKRKMCGFTHIW